MRVGSRRCRRSGTKPYALLNPWPQSVLYLQLALQLALRRAQEGRVNFGRSDQHPQHVRLRHAAHVTAGTR